MIKPSIGHDPIWQGFHGPNLGYIIELYEKYLEDPELVDPEMRAFFEKWGPPIIPKEEPQTVNTEAKSSPPSLTKMEKVLSAIRLADRIRYFGHLAANIYPLNDHVQNNEVVDPENYGLSEQDLSTIPASMICPDAPEEIRNGLEAINYLKKSVHWFYCI